jgi:hypothetical protein
MPTEKYESYWRRRQWELGWYRGTREFGPFVYSDNYCSIRRELR